MRPYNIEKSRKKTRFSRAAIAILVAAFGAVVSFTAHGLDNEKKPNLESCTENGECESGYCGSKDGGPASGCPCICQVKPDLVFSPDAQGIQVYENNRLFEITAPRTERLVPTRQVTKPRSR